MRDFVPRCSRRGWGNVEHTHVDVRPALRTSPSPIGAKPWDTKKPLFRSGAPLHEVCSALEGQHSLMEDETQRSCHSLARDGGEAALSLRRSGQDGADR